MDLAAAYEPFVAALLAGDFGAPTGQGWSADMIAAHVARNNECFTAAARAALEGRVPEYDNEVAVDPAELREAVERFGDRSALAEWVRRSAQELAALHAALTDEQRAISMPTRIRSDGEVVVDEPRPLGVMIEGNAGFHLAMHLAQLQSLAESG